MRTSFPKNSRRQASRPMSDYSTRLVMTNCQRKMLLVSNNANGSFYRACVVCAVLAPKECHAAYIDL